MGKNARRFFFKLILLQLVPHVFRTLCTVQDAAKDANTTVKHVNLEHVYMESIAVQ